MVVDGPKTYDTMVRDNPGKNTYQDPPAKKRIDREKNEKKDNPNVQTYDLVMGS